MTQKKVSCTGSNGPPRNYCGALEVNLKICAKGTKLRVYNEFEVISRLKINLEKSKLISVGVAGNVEAFAATLVCRVGHLPTTYVGSPFGATFKVVRVWDKVEEWFQ